MDISATLVPLSHWASIFLQILAVALDVLYHGVLSGQLIVGRKMVDNPKAHWVTQANGQEKESESEREGGKGRERRRDGERKSNKGICYQLAWEKSMAPGAVGLIFPNNYQKKGLFLGTLTTTYIINL